MQKVKRVTDPRQVGIHIESRPNLEVFIYDKVRR